MQCEMWSDSVYIGHQVDPDMGIFSSLTAPIDLEVDSSRLDSWEISQPRNQIVGQPAKTVCVISIASVA